MKKKLYRNCPICGCEQGRVLTSISLMPVENELLPSDFDVCLCERCKFCFDDMLATQDHFDAYYQSTGKYAQANTGGSGGIALIDIERWERVIHTISPFISKSQRIIDIGCGKGGLLKVLKEFGFLNLVGVEPSSLCREVLNESGIASYSSLSECLGKEKSFDCVVCSQVLEHVYFLADFLGLMKRVMSADGIVYIDVPDASGYATYFHAPFHYFDREHINHFTTNSLNNLFGQLLSFLPVFTESTGMTLIAGVKYPNLCAVFQMAQNNIEINNEDPAVDNLEAYKTLSAHKDSYIEIDELKGSVGPVLLWGLGSHLRRLMKKGVFDKVPVVGIIDRDRGSNGEVFSGYPILAPSAINDLGNTHATIIITSVLYAKQIHESLLTQRFCGRIIRITE